jgi:apolipoprotein N-acyltransferase
MKKFLHKHQLLLFSLLTGLLLSLSWPAGGFPFLAFAAFVPLLWVEHYIFMHRDRYRPFSVFFHAWIAFLVFNVSTTWWILYATVPGMVVAMLLNSLFMSVPVGLMHLARRVLPGRQGPVSLLFFWLSFEYLHARWDLSWSWLDLGNVFAAFPAWVQWYEYTGVAGGSVWILSVNLVMFYLLRQLFPKGPFIHRYSQSEGPVGANHQGTAQIPGAAKKTIILSVILAAAFVVPSLISFSMWHGYEEVPDPVEVVVVQPSIDPYDQARTPEEAQRRIDRMISLADQALTPQTRFVVAPEGASPHGIWMGQEEMHAMVRSVREHIAYHPGLTWVFGSMVYRLYAPGQQAPPSARPNPGGDGMVDVFNSSLMIEEGRAASFYHKSKLVPGIEQMPFYRVLGPLGKIVERFGGTASSLGTQDRRGMFQTSEDMAVAPVICYESIYGDYMRGYYHQGAGLILIMTNDGWWRNTPGHRQHNQYARLRAIESRKSIARAASTGISSFINQRGEMLKQSGWWESTAMVHTLNQNHRLTFFALHGNFLGKLSLFLTLLLLLYMGSQRVIRKSGRR